MATRMHADELDIDEDLVRRLLAAQLPRWADRPLARVPSSSTDNALYKSGDDLVVRLPRIGWAVGAEATDRGLPDGPAVTAAWDRALATPPHGGPPVWVHGDIARGNLLLRDGRLAAVIDFGGCGVGDPACDLLVAWDLFDPPERAVLRDGMGADDATWDRARGWALASAVQALPYYLRSNPPMAAQARHKIAAVLADPA